MTGLHLSSAGQSVLVFLTLLSKQQASEPSTGAVESLSLAAGFRAACGRSQVSEVLLFSLTAPLIILFAWCLCFSHMSSCKMSHFMHPASNWDRESKRTRWCYDYEHVRRWKLLFWMKYTVHLCRLSYGSTWVIISACQSLLCCAEPDWIWFYYITGTLNIVCINSNWAQQWVARYTLRSHCLIKRGAVWGSCNSIDWTRWIVIILTSLIIFKGQFGWMLLGSRL